MGKASKWFRSIFSSKRSQVVVEEFDANKHAIAVAVATAAVAEAAVAAAHAAAEVVRLTTRPERVRHFAAVKIQSSFRAYLARRALKALRGLVKLQALVRARIVRKRSADILRRMQAMARIQARASLTRSQHPATFQHDGQTLKNMPKYGSRPNVMNHNVGERTLPSSWLDRWMDECTWINHENAKHKCGGDENNDKILEIDTWKPHQNPRRMLKPFLSSQYFSAWKDSTRGHVPLETDSTNSTKYKIPNPSFSPVEASSIKSFTAAPEEVKLPLWTAENSPHAHSASSRPGSSKRRNASSPVRSEGGRSFYGDYLSYPNYMAITESYEAKVRSQSAPKQRSQFDNSTSRQFVHCPWGSDTRSEKDSTLHFSYQKGYSGSAQIGKRGSPVPANSRSIHSR